jgi:asparagine synthase (glutamine-hydrolysing)
MCGICGVVRSDPAPVEQDLLKKMNDALVHRGPDGEGYYLTPGVGLAMRRLAIIDLNTGDQPIPNEDETIWIVFNGEIFNFQGLREELEACGHHFRTKTDTECIVHLYEEYGDDCVNHLRGQFAFAIWDQIKQRLLIARDRLGQKPLYYGLQDGNLYFSSELSSLLKALPTRIEINFQAIDLYLSLQYIPEPLTPYLEIYKLPAANKLVFEHGELHIERYWQLEFYSKQQIPEKQLLAEMRELLAEAVQLRMISDVPLGAHLSGGIDSSIIVALMAQTSDLPIRTFSVGFEEASFSELPYARQVADLYGTEHREFTLSFGDIPGTLEKILTHFGEPFADPSAIPMYYLSKLTREFVTVALNGDGGDEAFAGYQRYWLDPWADRYTQLPGWITTGLIPKIIQRLPDKGEKPVGGSLMNGLKRLDQLAQIDPRASILRWGSYFSPAWKTALWRRPLRDQAETFLIQEFEEAHAEGFLDRTLATDIHTYLPGNLLVKADRMTMANSLEGRSPFLDHEFAEWAARLPADLKVRGLTGKYLLRKAFKDDLPPGILKRGKQGFGIPLGSWFRGPLAAWTEDILLGDNSPMNAWFHPEIVGQILQDHTSGKENHGKRIYALVMLSLWLQLNFNNR